MNLFITNLSQETTEDDLRQKFSEFGNIVSAKVIKDLQTGFSKGFGFVEMEDKNTAIDAIDNLDATYLKGNIIGVKEAKPRPGDKNSKPSYPKNNYNKNSNNRSYNSNNNNRNFNSNNNNYNSSSNDNTQY